MVKCFIVLTGSLLMWLLPQLLLAQVTASSMFTSNMVWQQNTDVNIWGWANAGETLEIDLSSIAAGVYFVKINTTDKTEVRKIVKD